MSDSKPDNPQPPAPAAAPPAPPPAAAAPPAAPPAEPTASWLNPRLDQAARAGESKVLKELGVTDLAAAKQVIADSKKRAEADKSDNEKAAERIAEHERTSSRNATLEAAVTEHAARQMAGLTKEQGEAVKKIAGDDSAAQLRAIDALSPTWTATPIPGTPADPPPEGTNGDGKPPAEPPGGDTAPARAAPKDDAASTSPTDHGAAYQRLRETNPYQANIYAKQHGADIWPEKT